MLASGRESFYAVEGTADTAWDTAARKAVPVKENPRTLRVEHLRRANRRLDGNDSATLWDMNDGVLLLEFHSKMNSIDDGIVEMMNRALDRAEASFRGLVIGNDGANFSAGANIMALLMTIKSDDLASV
jgi:3-hydroxyacyl-CoA dehydrogenase